MEPRLLSRMRASPAFRAISLRIVLAHNPLTVEKLGGQRCDLMLSGHTHGGQVMVPGLGRLALGPGGRRFSAGLYRVGHTWLYVNKGIGFGLPIRYRVRPKSRSSPWKPSTVIRKKQTSLAPKKNLPQHLL